MTNEEGFLANEKRCFAQLQLMDVPTVGGSKLDKPVGHGQLSS